MAEYTFADLPDKEILHALIEAGINCNMNTIKSPKISTVTPVFKAYAALLTNFDDSDLKKPRFVSNFEIDSYNELESGFMFLNFYRCLNEIMDSVGVNDFSLRSFSKPDSNQFSHQISGLINFAKFREARLFQKFRDLQENRNELLRQNNAVRANIEDIKSKINQKQEENQANIDTIDDLRSRIRAVESRISDIEDGKSDLQVSLDTMKMQKEQIQEHINSLKESISITQKNTKLLESQIHHKPDDLDERIAQAKSLISNQNQTIAAKENDKKQFAEKESSYKKLQNTIYDIGSILEPIMRDIRKKSSLQDNSKQLDIEKNDLKNIKEAVSKLRQERDKILLEHKKSEEECGDLNKKVTQIKNDSRKAQKSHERDLYEIYDQISNVRVQVSEFNNRLRLLMKTHSFAIEH